MAPPPDAHADAPLMLSVSGLRGIVDKSLTAERVTRFARAFGSFIIEQSSNANPIIVLGRDSRPSGEKFADAAVHGFTSVGCDVVRLGIVATPTVAVMITHLSAHGGMVVTASHNPSEWNGLKTLSAAGAAPPKCDSDVIIQRFRDQSEPDSVRPREQRQQHDTSANEVHLKRVLAAVDPAPIRKRKFKVVLDSVNGAGGPAGRALLETLGCDVIHLNSEPDGNFPHAPEPAEANLRDLARETKAHGADIGFAQDPDADRLAIVDETGTYIGEEYTLALAAWQVLQTLGPGVLIANLSTSRMIDDVAARYSGATVLRTPVGEANVVASMQSHNAVLGGEGNGGVILPQVCLTRDSLSAMALVLALMAFRHAPLSEIITHLPRYVMIKQKFDLSPDSDAASLRTALDRVRSHYANIPGAKINDEDGLRIDLEDSWVHLRGSNTEPIVRLIAEAKTQALAQRLIDEVARVAVLDAR
jgi:phosphomannomutase